MAKPLAILSLSLWQIWRRSLHLVVHTAPLELTQLGCLAFVSGTGPTVTLWLNKLIIDDVATLVRQSTIEIPSQHLLDAKRLCFSLMGLVVLNLVVDAANTVSEFAYSALRDRITGEGQRRILEKVASFPDMALFEQPVLLNHVKLAEQGIERLKHLAFIIVTTLTALFRLIPTVLLSSYFVWWIPVVLIVTAIPSIRTELKYRKQSWETEKTQAEVTRSMALYRDVLTGEAFAQEIRLLNLQSYYLHRWNQQFHRMFRRLQRVRRQGTIRLLAWSVVNGLGIALPLIYVVLGALGDRFTLGDLALYVGLILQIRQSLFVFINNGSDLYDLALGIGPIFQLLDLQPQLQIQTQLPPTPSSRSRPKTGIEIRQLSFRYPGHPATILQNINLTLRPGETVVLVGENGTGKTTLAKLLCRLYDPEEGCILWHGQDIRTLDWQTLRSRLAVVVQDYARFPATIRENVGFGALMSANEFPSTPEIKAVLKRVNLAHLLDGLPQGLDTPLSKQLKDGMDLSKGQWQRLAIARSLLRLQTAELLIWDEPMASLDANSEYELQQHFQKLAANKMTLAISHRLGLCRLADRVVVLQAAQIVEIGTHDELMQYQGHYYELFSRQASRYRERSV